MTDISKPETPTGSRIAWTSAEDATLLRAVAQYNGKNWKAVAAMLPNRTRAQCAHRYQKVLNPDIKKGAWSATEDDQLSRAVEKNGPGKWSRIAESVTGRNGKQCRERWQNHLRSDVKKDPWSEQEDELIIRLRSEMGNRWAQIARYLPGRTENAVKNRWNAKLALEAKEAGIPTTPRSCAASVATTPRSTGGQQSNSSFVVPPRPVPRLDDLDASRKRTLSLLSVLSQVSSDSLRTEIAKSQPGTPEPAAKRAKGQGSELAGAEGTSSVVSQTLPSASEALNKLLMQQPSNFSAGQFKISSTEGVPTTPTTPRSRLAESASKASSDLDWLASIAAARALTGLTSAAKAPSQ